jgi:ribulose-phosphate 3-epimerase
MALIAPALLAADFARLGDGVRIIEAGGCRRVHIDVADGHFGHELTVGQPVFESIRKATRLELDLHLLIERPERYIGDFAGADRIAIHPESTPQIHRALDLVRGRGSRPGVAVLPGTSIDSLEDVLDGIDFMIILAADPVFGPDFERRSRVVDAPDRSLSAGVRKVQRAARMRTERGLGFEIQAEGRLQAEHLEQWAKAGADILVGGFAIFDRELPVEWLKDLVRRGQACPSEVSSGNFSAGRQFQNS